MTCPLLRVAVSHLILNIMIICIIADTYIDWGGC